MSATTLQIFIAEDEAMIRNSLIAAIRMEPDMNVIGFAENGLDALQSIRTHQPDLVLMDIQMPGLNGIECIKKLRELRYAGIILILTSHSDEQYIIEGLANGATGYLLKSPHFQSMIQTIRDAMKGQYILPAEVATKLVRYIQENNPSTRHAALTKLMSSHAITQREREVIVMLLNRLSNKEIAEKLYVSNGTVKNHLTSIYEKLGVNNRQEAIHYLKLTLQ